MKQLKHNIVNVFNNVLSKNYKEETKVLFAIFLVCLIFSLTLFLPTSNTSKNTTSLSASLDNQALQKPTPEETPIPSPSEEKEPTPPQGIDIDYYRQRYNNNDIQGILEVPNLFTSIVTQTTNNTYYLNHSVSREKNIVGNEFLDYRINAKSNQINIYGHNSRDYDTNFRLLENYLDKNYFEQNPYIYYKTAEKSQKYLIFSIKGVSSDFEHMTVNLSGNAFVSHIKDLQQDSIYKRIVEYDENSEIIVLQTCSYNPLYSYYIISAIAVS